MIDTAAPRWIRSARCDNSGPNCVEAAYITSGRSVETNCVQGHRVGDEIHVRDSKNPHGPVLAFTYAEWEAFVHGIDDGGAMRFGVEREPAAASA